MIHDIPSDFPKPRNLPTGGCCHGLMAAAFDMKLEQMKADGLISAEDFPFPERFVENLRITLWRSVFCLLAQQTISLGLPLSYSGFSIPENFNRQSEGTYENSERRGHALRSWKCAALCGDSIELRSTEAERASPAGKCDLS
jgi:hypothetical protein